MVVSNLVLIELVLINFVILETSQTLAARPFSCGPCLVGPNFLKVEKHYKTAVQKRNSSYVVYFIQLLASLISILFC